MINKVKQAEEINYGDFRESLDRKIHPTLHDTAAKKKDCQEEVKLNFVRASFGWDNWSVIKNENNEIEYFLMHDPLFKSIIYEDLIEKASKKYPECFGTNEPDKVLEALSLTFGINHDSSKAEWYRQTSYVAITNKKKEKVLYLGLFRTFFDIEKNKNEEEFKNGYLHCLNHFCGSDEQPITTKSEPKILPENFIEHIIRCLFEGSFPNGKNVKIPNDKYYTYKYIINEKEYKFGFYYSAKFDIFFLSDAHREDK